MKIGVYISGAPKGAQGFFLEIFSDPNFQVTFLQITPDKDPWKAALNHSRDHHANHPLLLIQGNSFSSATAELMSELHQVLQNLEKWKVIYLGWEGAACDHFKNPLDLGISRAQIYRSNKVKLWRAVLINSELAGVLRQQFKVNLEDQLRKQEALVFYPPVFLAEPTAELQLCQTTTKTTSWTWFWILLVILLILGFIWWIKRHEKKSYQN